MVTVVIAHRNESASAEIRRGLELHGVAVVGEAQERGPRGMAGAEAPAGAVHARR